MVQKREKWNKNQKRVNRKWGRNFYAGRQTQSYRQKYEIIHNIIWTFGMIWTMRNGHSVVKYRCAFDVQYCCLNCCIHLQSARTMDSSFVKMYQSPLQNQINSMKHIRYWFSLMSKYHYIWVLQTSFLELIELQILCPCTVIK